MSIIIQHDIASMIGAKNLGINSDSRAKASERLNSGLRINRAADDAASLTISEKMRSQIRGLRQASDNALDGISFIGTAEGAMNEMSAIIQRMRELAVRASNDTFNDEDKKVMEMEFEHLQSELDRMTEVTEFNTMDVFEQHEPTYYSVKGNRTWSHSQLHEVAPGGTDLIVTVPNKTDGAVVTYEVNVPPGIYTTQELVDEIDTAIAETIGEDAGLVLEFTKDGVCNMNYEGGTEVKTVGGSLSYLIYDSYSRSSSYGSLIGTTSFIGDNALRVTKYNNELEFYLESIDGTYSDNVKITIPPGSYTRTQMIEYLNGRLAGKGVEAKEYGEHYIEISGDYLVTGLKGNMFEIDTMKYSSVFYDNAMYGSVAHTTGYLKGSARFTTNPDDTEHNHISIDDTNHILKIKANAKDTDPYIEIELEKKNYTVMEMAGFLNQKFKDSGIDATVHVGTTGSFQYLEIKSNVSGDGSKIDADKTCSAYKTLFCDTTYFQKYSVSPTVGVYTSSEPYVLGGGTLSFPIMLDSTNKELKLDVKDGKVTTSYTLSLAEKNYADMNEVVAEVNNQIQSKAGIKDKIVAKNNGGKLLITTAGMDNGVSGIKASTGGAYHPLLEGEEKRMNAINVSDRGDASSPPAITMPKPLPVPPDKVTIDGNNNTIKLNYNGTLHTVTIPNGDYTSNELADKLTEALKPTETTRVNNIDVSGKGTEDLIEGTTLPKDQSPAKVVLPNNLASSIKVDSTCDTFSFNLNGSMVSVKIPEGEYTPAEFYKELNQLFQAKGLGVTASLSGNKLQLTTTKQGSDASLHVSTSTGGSAMQVIAGTTKTKFDGIKASIDSSGNLVLSGLKNGSGNSLSVSSTNGGNMLSLFATYSNVAVGPSTQVGSVTKSYSQIDGVNLTAPVTINADNKKVKFQYNHNGTSYPVEFELEEKNYSFNDLQSALQSKIDAAVGGSGRLKVSAGGSGVVITAENYGNQYTMTNFSEGFHTYIISGSKTININGTPAAADGKQYISDAFIVGRQNVNESCVIKSGVNDELIVDFTAPDENGVSKEFTFTMKLAAGTYAGKNLSDEVQKKLNEELKKQGFKEGMIEVGIGTVSTSVAGNDDKNALTFKLSDKVGNLGPGSYIIDGVRGTAAFTVFYKTDGLP